MDFTDLLDWVADQLALAVPGNVIAYLSSYSAACDVPDTLYKRYMDYKRLGVATRERIVREWFDAIEPAEPRFTPWQGPWPTDGY